MSHLTLRSSVYSQDTLQHVHALLQRVLPSLAQFAFARPAVSTASADDARSEATLSFFFRLAALLLKEETFSALTAFLAQSKAPKDQEAQEAGRVPPSYREPIHLYYLEGCSTEEIASILQTRPSTIRSRLTRARAMLRDRLKEAYDFDE